ncbi:hypothetical protein JW911_03840 [Candidatus Peregrinibacteria bacterium]|nr:hypothetical protein [Candidatus Peregrinibacteria bacterium]
MEIKKRSIAPKERDLEKEAALKAKTISKKKILFTEIDDEITGIYDKLKKYKMRNIYIVVPKRAVLFQSIVNLRILKRKSDDLGKTIYIITNDQNGMQLAQRAGFQVFDKLESNEHPSLVSGKLPDDQLKITPLEASINTYEDDTPTRLKSKKLSIAELVRRTKKTETSNTMPESPSQKKRAKEKTRFVLVSPNRQALTILFTIVVLILILIVYIALPGATIYLTPKSNTISVSANVVLAEASRNQSYLDTHPQNVIASFNVETTIDKKITYFTSGNKFEGKNATGTLKIINTSGREWPLIEQTRFQTSEGLIFRIQKSVNVPAGSISGPGSLDAYVVADEVDANGQIIGDRGNIGPSRFFLPGLSEENRQKVYAESSEAFIGGETITHKMITKEDLDAAKGKMEAELRNSAEEELKKAVGRMNQEKNMDLVLLTGSNAMKLENPAVNAPMHLEGQMQEQFEISGTMQAKGLAYNHNELSNILRAKLKLSKSPEKKLIKIDSESISYRLIPIEAGADPTRLTITATIKGVEQYEIDPDKENGQRLISNIKEHVLGKSVDEAENYIQQLPAINKVVISSWPAWSPTMPSVPDNIKIEIKEE